MSAQHAREGIAGKHRALSGAAARYHIVGRSGIQQNGRQDSVLHVGELIFILRAVHAVVDNLMSHGLHNLFQNAFHKPVLRSLAVFIDQCDFHWFFLLSARIDGSCGRLIGRH